MALYPGIYGWLKVFDTQEAQKQDTQPTGIVCNA